MILQDYWTKDDAIATKSFFNSPPGQKLIELMIAAKPRIGAGSKDERYDESIARQTWEDCVNKLAEYTLEPLSDNESELKQFDMSDRAFTSKVRQ